MEHSLTNLLGHDSLTEAGRTLRQWVHFQWVHFLLDLLSRKSEDIKANPTQTVYHQDEHGQFVHLRNNQTKQLAGLTTCMRYIFESYNSGPDLPEDPLHPSTRDQWVIHTPSQMRTYLIQHLPNPLVPYPVPSGPITSSRPTGYSPAALELMGFKRVLKEKLLHTL